MTLAADLEIVDRIGREAGAIVRQQFRRVERLVKTHAVASNEAVTEADRASQRYIVTELRKAFPGSGFIGEESDDGAGITLDIPTADARVWVIDPIDGTNNFIAGLGGFCVCIGLIERGMPVLGTVYDVCADRMYRAAKGLSATVNGEKILVQDGPMHEASILCMTANLMGKDNRLPGWASSLLAQIHWKVRILGSAALEAVLVAEGVAGAAIQVNTKLWDIAGAAAIVLEAGGIVTTLDGGSVFPIDLQTYQGQKVPYLTGGAKAHADVLKYLRERP